MGKSARMTVLLDPRDKASIETRASRQGVSVGEFVRRASEAYDPSLDDRVIEAMVEEWARSMEEVSDRLRGSLDRAEARMAEMADLKEARHGAG